MKNNPLYKRVLLKLSGEALVASPNDHGFHGKALDSITASIKKLYDGNIEVGIVIGAGNIFRGAEGAAFNLGRESSDYAGMLATMINGIVLQQKLTSMGCECYVMSALGAMECVEPFSHHRALNLLSHKAIVIFAGGCGNPYFTTDTAAALRAGETRAEILLKATKVDGVYDKDPVIHPDAQKYTTLTYDEAIQKKLKVMDLTALSLCQENNIPVRVCNMSSLVEAIHDKNIGTLITKE
jgi:uridylate kinase